MSRDLWAAPAGADATSHIPWERWDADSPHVVSLHKAAGSDMPAVRFGVFLPPELVMGFDAPAFGMSTPEAVQMDPQQRQLLEVFAEALLPGGQPQQALGVFVGISSMDYQKLLARYTRGVSTYSATGVSLSVAAGRLSYSFGLKGPALAVDTACSSSLVSAS